MSSPLSTQAAGSPQIETTDSKRGRKSRLWGRSAAIAVGLSLASCGGAIATAASQNGVAPVNTRATRFEQKIRSLEARGYVQAMCTRKGTAMYDASTHRFVNINF